MSVGRPGSSRRVIGLDLFRALAVFGMLVAHVGPSAWTADDGFGVVHWQWEAFHSRMPAMFAFAAGLSLNLGERPVGRGPRSVVIPTLVRASLLTLCGVLLTALGTPVAVILAYFGLYFVLALPLRRCRARTLFVIAGAWAFVGPALSFALRGVVDLPGNPLWTGLVDGDYPAMTWMPFVIVGMAVGRLDLTDRRIRLRMGTIGIGIAAAAYGISALFMFSGGREQIMAALPSADGRSPAQVFARAFFRETGVTDTSSWLWLLTPAPHSGSWADILGAVGVCLALLALLLPLGDWAALATGARARDGARWFARALAAAGAMVLSVYAAHIVAMWMITATTGHSFRGSQSVFILGAFTLASTAFASLWMARWDRGPLETVIYAITRLTSRTGRRESA